MERIIRELRKESKGTNFIYGVYKIVYNEYTIDIVHYTTNKILAKITNYFIYIFPDIDKNSLLYSFLRKLSKKNNLKMFFMDYSQTFINNKKEVEYKEKLIKEVI